MRQALVAVSLALLCATILAQTAAPNETKFADTVLRHGTVLTVDDQDHVANAIAIRSGRIVAVGTDAEVDRFIGPGTRVVDLSGRTVTPGMIDTHAHILEGVTDAMFKADLTKAKSIAEILAIVKSQSEKTPAGAWVQAFGWNEGIIAEHHAPSLAELDSVTAGHPALLENVTHHYGMVNSAALAIVGIDVAAKDIEGGTIVRGPDGKPTGLLREKAQDLVIRAIPPFSETQSHQGVQAVLDRMHSLGLTGVKDIVYPSAWNAYLSFAKSDGLTAHICPLMWAGSTIDSAKLALAAIQQGHTDTQAIPDGDLRVCGAKILLDGSAMGHTAWRNEDYPPDPHFPGPPGHGYPLVDPEQYRAMVKLFNAAGVQIGTHAIGDRAIDLVVDSYAAALKENPQVGLRHSIIHEHEPTAHALEVMQQLQSKYDAGIPEAQASFLYYLGDSLPAAFGPDQSQHVMPFATYRKLGLIYSNGSDFPVTSIAPQIGLWASVAREPFKGVFGPHPFGTAESVDIHTALRSYTQWSAHQLFLEKETGTVEPGKWADLAVWDRDPYSIPTSELKEMKCTMTIYKGKVVYEATR
jgi:predicted amidohydrolase YtcJ